jgi:predicted esterase
MLHPFPPRQFAPSPTVVDLHASNDCFPFPRWLAIKREVSSNLEKILQAAVVIAVEFVVASIGWGLMPHVFPM